MEEQQSIFFVHSDHRDMVLISKSLCPINHHGGTTIHILCTIQSSWMILLNAKSKADNAIFSTLFALRDRLLFVFFKLNEILLALLKVR
jgi:hypothetical protein